MAEQLMETTVRTALWQQFSAAIAMLENALLACPETLWQEHLWIDVESADDGTFWRSPPTLWAVSTGFLPAAHSKLSRRSRRGLMGSFPGRSSILIWCSSARSARPRLLPCQTSKRTSRTHSPGPEERP